MGSVEGPPWKDCRKLALDSNCFIYLLEDSPFRTAAVELFRAIEQGEVQGVTSVLSITELMTGPYRMGDARTVEEYRTTLLQFPHLSFRSVDFPIAEKAADLRVRYSLRTPDALQLATAMLSGAEALVSNDKDFAKVDFPVILLGSSSYYQLE